MVRLELALGTPLGELAHERGDRAQAGEALGKPAGHEKRAEAERELGKIPFFVRGKARRNTERFACERGVATITLETLYDAKAHYSR